MIGNIINRIRAELTDTFNEVFGWFDVSAGLLNYAPSNGAWNVSLVLEHISLTNQYLLILIRKGTAKALDRSKKNAVSPSLEGYDFNWQGLQAIGKHKSFKWNRPEHMEPGGNRQLEDVRKTLQLQLDECLLLLSQLENGEGVLYRTMMTVNGLGKIDVYQYIYFLCQHAKRHITQLQRLRAEFFMNQHVNP